MHIKPLVRWIVGPVFPNGFKSVALSYKKMRLVYGDAFDYLICHNQLTNQQLKRLEAIGCPLYEQRPDHFGAVPTPWPEDVGSMAGTRCAWKLYPPRLRVDGHEVIMDNDIVVQGRLRTLERFLQAQRPMLSRGRRRNYGYFDEMIPQGFVFNNGLIGLPPGLDFEARLRRHLPEEWEWTYFFDDQGLVVLSLHDLDPWLVGFDEIAICGPNDDVPSTPGIHFIGLNSNHRHGGWEKYRKDLRF